VIVDEEDQIADRRELLREGFRELPKTPLEAAPTIQRGCEVLREIRGVTAHGADEIGEEDEWILVAASKGEPGGTSSRSTKEVGGLR